jgi:RNA polymerase sigma factor (sigma-70 family)
MSKVEARAREQQLILDNMGLVVSLARSFNPRNNQELEEYIQSGRIGLWKAIKKYDANKGALSTIAWNYIRWEIIRSLPDSKKMRNKNLKQVCFTDISESNFALAEYYDESSRQEIQELLPDSLTKQEQALIMLKLDGFTMNEIGNYFGKSRVWAHTIYKKAFEKIKEANSLV